jgi:LPXTG-motif cell wall-anchored protein
VIQDWEANGVVDKTYAADCYASALRELPEDARIYSSATSDILAARARSGAQGNPNRSLQSAQVASTPRAVSAGGVSSSSKALTAVGAAAVAAASAVLVRRRRRGKRTELPSSSDRL